jgi:predicted nucleic acid-binding protein
MSFTIASPVMKTDVAFDTNILLYLAGDDAKADVSLKLLTEGGIINPLVLTEAVRVARKKWRWTWPATKDLVATIRANTVCLPMGCDAHERGVRYAERYKLQIFDATIIAAAVLADCTTLYSEDMHDGLKIDGLTVWNPFRD